MSDVNQFRAFRVPNSLLSANNFTASNQMPLFDYVGGVANYGMASVLSGAVTASTYKTILSITGSGVINFLGARTINSTAKIAALRVTIDGVVVFDGTTTSFAQANRVICALGFLTHVTASGVNYLSYNPVAFNQSFLVEIMSSLTETDQTQLVYNGNLFT